MKKPTIILCILCLFSIPAFGAGTWSQIRHGNATLFQPYVVEFAGAEHAWAFRSYGQKSYLKKMSGPSPTNWVDQKTFTFGIHAMKFITPRLGWIVGDTGRIIRTPNGGATWYSVNYQSKKNLMDIEIRNRYIWVVGADNTIVVSPNSGKTWQEVNPGLKSKYTFTGVAFATDKIGWIVGYRIRKGARIVILFTRDRGRTWTPQTDAVQKGYKKFIPKDIHATDAGWAYIVGTKAKFLMTTDEGKHWKPALNLRMGEKTTLNKISFPVSRIGWISGDHGRILKTIDAGFHWTLQVTPMRPCEGFCNMVDIHMLSPKLGYAFSNWGDVIKYTDQ